MVVSHRHKDPYRAFFTIDELLGDYMVSLLNINDADSILEPSAGVGHLIDCVRTVSSKAMICAYEVNNKFAQELREKFRDDYQVKIYEKDTIFCEELDHREKFGPKFNKIIANPPYGGWQEQERRLELKIKFPGFYVRETYTLFLLRSLHLLEDNGRLVFIIPATFLYLNSHVAIRKFVFNNFTLESVDYFKSKLFPGISFGYADLCIICISAKKSSNAHCVKLRFIESLHQLINSNSIEHNQKTIAQSDVMATDDCSISTSMGNVHFDRDINIKFTMGDIANCVTGFYSGNDKHYLMISSNDIKRSKGYGVIQEECIENNPCQYTDILQGINGKGAYIPILKGGGYQFLKPSMWFVNWSNSAVEHYKTDKKARFQNSGYYFKNGIGFPMVTSNRPTAALIRNSLFDQSIVGIFPTGNVTLEFLLAYCNSLTFWNSLKQINPSANNSAKYIRKTPIFVPDENVQQRITLKTKELIHILDNNHKGSELLAMEIIRDVDSSVSELPKLSL